MLLREALAALPEGVREVRLRADGGYFVVDLVVAAYREGVGFAIGAKRITPLWRIWAGVEVTDWVEAIDMPGAQVAVADYRPTWWPTSTRLLIRHLRLDSEQISSYPRARWRRTLHPRPARPAVGRAGAGRRGLWLLVYPHQLDVCTPATAAAVEHWYRHRTEIEKHPGCQARGGVASPPVGIRTSQLGLDGAR